MSVYRCPKGCNFHTNSPIKMIHHSVTVHNAKYSKEYIMKIVTQDQKLKAEVLKLVMKQC